MNPLKQLRNIKLCWLLLILGAAACIHAWIYVATILAAPEAIPNLYARTWSFQLIAFSIVRLPLWLVVLAIVLAIRAASKQNQPLPVIEVEDDTSHEQ